MNRDYIAGLIDADGCLEISKQSSTSKLTGKTKHYFYAKAIISNNNLEVLEMIQKYFGCGRIYIAGDRCYNLVFHNTECRKVLDDIGGLLFIKRREYLLLNRFFENEDNRALYHIELRNMKRGYIA